MSVEEVFSLYSVCENKRDKAILGIGYGAGARREEIVKLNVIDVQLTRGILIVRHGKFDKRREIPLSNSIAGDLKDYLVNERHNYAQYNSTSKTDAFLVNDKGNRMSGDAINKRIKILIEKVGNTELSKKEITLHCLRHSIGTHLIDNGASIEFVRDYLGHEEIDTAHIYSRRRKLKQQLNAPIL